MVIKLKETDGHADGQTSKVVLSAAFCSNKYPGSGDGHAVINTLSLQPDSLRTFKDGWAQAINYI